MAEEQEVDLLHSLDEATRSRWRSIGTEEGLSGDVAICKYLIHLYETANSKVSAHLRCLRCGNPVSMVCDECRATPPQPPEVDKGGELLLSPEHQQTSTSASSADGTTPSTQMKLIPTSPSQDSDSESLHVELVVMDSRDRSQSQPQRDRRSESLFHQPCSSPAQESDSESMYLECQPATPDSPGGATELSSGPSSPVQTKPTRTSSRLASLLPGGKPCLQSQSTIATSQTRTSSRLVSLLPAGKPRLRSQTALVSGSSSPEQTSQTNTTTPVSMALLPPDGKPVLGPQAPKSESPLILRSLFQVPSTAAGPSQSPSLPPHPAPLPPPPKSPIPIQIVTIPPPGSPLPPQRPLQPAPTTTPARPQPAASQAPFPVSLASRAPFPSSLPLRIPLKSSHTVPVPAVRKPALTPLTVILPKVKDPVSQSQSQSAVVSGAEGAGGVGPESGKQSALLGQGVAPGAVKPVVPLSVEELDPNRDKSVWTELESTSLMEYVRQSGIVSPLTSSFWKTCAQFLNTIFKTSRTDNDCSEQYVKLVRQDSYLRRVVTVDKSDASASQPSFTYRLQYMQLLNKDSEPEPEPEPPAAAAGGGGDQDRRAEDASDKSDEGEGPPQDEDEDDLPPMSKIRRARHNAWQKVRHREANERFKRALALELAGETNNMDFIYLGLEELGLPSRSTDRRNVRRRRRKRGEEEEGEGGEQEEEEGGESQRSGADGGGGRGSESVKPGGEKDGEGGQEEGMDQDLTIPSADHNYIHPSLKLKGSEPDAGGPRRQKPGQKPFEQGSGSGSGRMKAYVCKVCTAYFNQYCKITAHLRHTHSGFRPAKCTHCPASFAIQGQLTKHMRRVHLKLERVLCQLCGASYCGMHALKQHLAHQHQGVQPRRDFVCELCGKRLASMHSLKCHKERRCGRTRRAFKPRREVCSACGLSFSSMLSLHHHMARKHPEEAASLGPLPPEAAGAQEEAGGGGPQIYSCTLCGVPFAFKSSLRHHMGRRHPKGRSSAEGQGQGQPPSGGSGGEVRAQLQPMKHLCSVCGAPYAELSSLRRHMNKRHPHEVAAVSAASSSSSSSYSSSSEVRPGSAMQRRLEGKAEPLPQQRQQLRGEVVEERVRIAPPLESHVCSVCRAPFAELRLLHRHMAEQHPVATTATATAAADARPSPASQPRAGGPPSRPKPRDGMTDTAARAEEESPGSVGTPQMTHMCSVCGELLAGLESLRDHMLRLHPPPAAAAASDRLRPRGERRPEGAAASLPPPPDPLLAKSCPTGQGAPAPSAPKKAMAPSLDLMPDDSFHMFLEAELAAAYIE